MRYLALATDYDGTLALHGRVDEGTLSSLERFKASGRKLVLVTGRELADLMRVFPRIELFDRVVAENGALLYRPAARAEEALGEAPPEKFVAALRARGVAPLSAGRVIVATWEPHAATVLETIRALGLEQQVIFNKGAVMILPPTINKATGLHAALRELGLSAHNVVGVGDAENDHAFLSFCECAVAVANALPTLKEHVDLITQADHGAGVSELIEGLLRDDLAEIEPRMRRHHLLLGHGEDGRPVHLPPYGVNVLLAGSSGGGKSTLATSFMERLSEQAYQFCCIDPEGDYQNLADAVALGSSRQPPLIEDVLAVLQNPAENCVVNLMGIPGGDRPVFFESLFAALLALRARSGRPHWIVIDEAHHLLPAAWAPVQQVVPKALQGILLITVEPDRIAPAMARAAGTLIAVGEDPERTLRAFGRATGRAPPAAPPTRIAPGEALLWREGEPVVTLCGTPPKAERLRHVRKYAVGELGPDKSFYFRGPAGKLRLRAQNLTLFLQLADGVDDATWNHHLQRGDYSRWLREAVKDEALADEVAAVERAANLAPRDSRALIRDKIAARYTEPAAGSP